MSLTITEYLPALPHLSKETVQTHYDELHTHLSDPKIHDQASATLIDGLEGSREKVKKEIAGLTSSLCEIRKSFGDIGVELGHFGLKDQWSEFVTVRRVSYMTVMRGLIRITRPSTRLWGPVARTPLTRSLF